MTILNELKNRSEQSQDNVKIDLKLYNLVDDIEKEARNHLKRVITVLPEFDIHDEKHSEKVIKNIEDLLGSNIFKLSSYELFLLHLSAFLHDCAMAPSEYEITVMKLTEGNNIYYGENFSIKHDLKPPLKYSESLYIINSNKDLIYKDFDLPAKWIFCDANETDFINYLAELLTDYQNFRNGFTEKLKAIENIDQFKLLNDFIRIDYIRATHHARVEKYIKNLEIKFGNAFEQSSWGRKLAHDLAKICRSHGENIDFVNQLSINSQYYGSDSANLQMVAIMLRLGDIIHYSFDRAPITILSSKIFKSEYSFQEWAVKNSGANYSIQNGLISYRAYCENPETYFKLHQYIDWIEIEIQNYFKFQRKWTIEYIENLQDKIDRSNINNDESKFLPKRGLGFSLNQKKILELLNGVGLYKDKFACLRELYQNSMDACKCMISKNEAQSIHIRGNIEFGIEETEDGSILYCLDNGIGMSKDIIEKYLLNIGNSYYKSSDFYKQQSKWNGHFTPTSQFGIGILSCFMIGNKIEITTKSEEDDYISCVINGIHDHFFYKPSDISSKEKITKTGTLIKIHLKSDIAQNLEYSSINKLGLLILGVHKTSRNFQDSDKIWEKHIYYFINNFIKIVPNNIDVNILLKNNELLPIFSKPLNVLENEKFKMDILENVKPINDFLNLSCNTDQIPPTIDELHQSLSFYKVKIDKENTSFFTIISLPKGIINFSFKKFNSTLFFLGKHGISIDGIAIEKQSINQFDHYFSDALSQLGCLDFSGENRPSISVDRKSIIEYPSDCEAQAKEISIQYIKKAIEIAKLHLEQYNILENTPQFDIVWDYILDKINFADVLFINELSKTKYGEILSNDINNILYNNISIKQFINCEKIILKKFLFDGLNQLSQKLVISKLMSADSIDIEGEDWKIHMKNFNTNLITKNGYDYRDDRLLIKARNWNVFNSDYDLITEFYPMIPSKLFDKLEAFRSERVSGNVKKLSNYSNGILGIFSQSPLLVHSKLGMYMGDKNIGRKKLSVYNFDNKRSDIMILELNENRHNNRAKHYILMAFISPVCLTQEEEIELQKHQGDSDYVKGISEGWSILITSMAIQNTVILAGKASREDLVNQLTDEFWKEYEDYEFRFTDETLMKRNMPLS